MSRAKWLTPLLASFLLYPLAAQPAAPTVTLHVTDEPVAGAAAAIMQQAGVQVGVVAPDDATVTLDLQEATVEQAVEALAKEYRGSWARFYLLESAPPQTPYSPDALIEGLRTQRGTWLDSLPAEQQEELMRRWRAPRPADQPPAPGAGSHAGRRSPGEAPAPPGLLYDPVRMVTIPLRTETISLSLAGVPLQQALCQLTTASGFLIAAGYNLTGTITAEWKEVPLEQALEEVATTVAGKWRRVYLLSKPRPLSEGEQEQMVDKEMTSRWNSFWAKPREERAKQIESLVRLLGQVKAMAAVPGPDGQPNMVARGLREIGPRIFTKVMELSAASTPQQRAEIKPAIAALRDAIGQ